MNYNIIEPTLEQADYEHARDHLEGLIADVYETGNIEDLEFHLEEVLAIFDLKAPASSPKLETKKSPADDNMDRMLKSWVGYTRAYADVHTNKIKI